VPPPCLGRVYSHSQIWDAGDTPALSTTRNPKEPDAQGLDARETLEIELRCPDVLFFEPAPDGCPAGPPMVTDGAEQHFQRGVMVWDWAEDRIYALFADAQDPAWRAYGDRFDEGEDPASDPSVEPPAGRYQPIRGFGKVSRADQRARPVGVGRGYRDRLRDGDPAHVVRRVQSHLHPRSRRRRLAAGARV